MHFIQKRKIGNLIVSIVLFHICSVIIIESRAVFFGTISGAIVDWHIYCRVYLCVKRDAESTISLSKLYNVFKVIIVVKNYNGSITMVEV